MRSLLLILAGAAASVPLIASPPQAKKRAPKVTVPAAPPSDARSLPIYDRQYGVRFEVPPGWSYNRHDGRVSTFHLDARSAPRAAELRAVAHIEFNPYPDSSFTGAIFYYSVQRHTSDAACERQATVPAAGSSPRSGLQSSEDNRSRDIQAIGGMNFAHGHDEKGRSCVEQRDEIYTAFRHGACYRFDLAVTNFCGAPIGVPDLTSTEVETIDARMTDILSTVALDWSASGPQHVDTPHVPDTVPPGRPASVGTQATGR